MTSNFQAEGYTKRTASEVRTDLQNWMTANNTSYRQQNADIQNNLLDTGVVQILELENLCGDLANGYAPTYANDFMWNLLAQSLGLTYKSSTQSSVTLKFTGNAGTYIPAGTTTNGGFATQESIILGTTGEGYVNAYSDTTAEFAAGEINTITTTISTGVTVTNPSASMPAKDETSLEELKLASQRKLRNARITNCDYCKANLLQLDGTQERLIGFAIREVASQASIEVVCGGGDIDEVANVIFNSFLVPSRFVSTPSDSDTNRTITHTLSYYNSPFTVKWTLPKALNLNIELALKLQEVVINTQNFQSILQTQLENEINTRNVGTPLNKALLNDMVYDIIASLGIDTYKISTVEWTIKDADTGTELTFNENDFLSAIEFDIYTILKSLSVVTYNI